METVKSTALQKKSGWETIEGLYKTAFYPVARYVSNQGGSLDDARDLFHDALLILYDDLQKGKIIDSHEHYVNGIAKNLWRSKVKATGKSDRLGDDSDVLQNAAPTVNEVRLLSLLKRTGDRCMNFLASIYFDGGPLRSVAKKFGYASEHSASVQKYKCLEKIRETIRTKSIAYEDLFE